MRFFKNNLFFTADTHFSHKNIVKYSNRPFANSQEMDQRMIENWNAKVPVNGVVWFLGDFAFSDEEPAQRILNRLNGSKHLIIGNHDKTGVRLKGWKSISRMEEIYAENQMIVLCHYAMKVWNKSHHGTWQLYGHSHGSLPDDPNALAFDVGVDCHNYTPLSFFDVERIMQKKTFKPIDHHGKK